MAIFTSERLANGGLPVQGSVAGERAQVSASITIPNGTAVANGDIFRFVRLDKNAKVLSFRWEVSDFDTGASIAAGTTGVAALRPVRDPKKAFNATTNPYITGGQSAQVNEMFVSAANAATDLQGGGLRTNTPTLANLALIDGTYDIGLVLSASPAGNPTTNRTITVYVEYVAPEETAGSFSGQNVYNYLDDTAL